MSCVEDDLPQNMKVIKEHALNEDMEAEYLIGLYYKNSRNTEIMAIGINFLGRAAKKGHQGARAVFSNDGQDWRDFIYS